MRLMILLLCALCAGAGPATKPESQEQQLRRIIRELQGQIAQLKAENTVLRKQAATQPVSKAKTLAVGMTVDQANKVLGQEGKLKYKTASQENYEWEFWTDPTPVPQLDNAEEVLRPRRYRTVLATFQDGRLVSFSELD